MLNLLGIPLFLITKLHYPLSNKYTRW